MTIELSLHADGQAQTIKHLWPLYQHDLSAFTGEVPNRYGIFSDDTTVTTIADHTASLDPWWRDPQALFPYLIMVDGAPAGFSLIAARSRLPDGIRADFVVHEFFVLHPYRGRGVAEHAAVMAFAHHRGAWEVVTYPTHRRARAFWRRVIARYTALPCEEHEEDHPWGHRIAFRFTNAMSDA